MNNVIVDWVDSLIPQVNEAGDATSVFSKFARENNLPPAQLEKMGHIFNIASTRQWMNSNPEARGATFPTLDVPTLVESYTSKSASGVPLYDAEADSSMDKAASSKTPGITLDTLSVFAGGMYGTFDRSDAISKAASEWNEDVEEPEHILEDDWNMVHKMARDAENDVERCVDEYNYRAKKLADMFSKKAMELYQEDENLGNLYRCEEALILDGKDDAKTAAVLRELKAWIEEEIGVKTASVDLSKLKSRAIRFNEEKFAGWVKEAAAAVDALALHGKSLSKAVEMINQYREDFKSASAFEDPEQSDLDIIFNGDLKKSSSANPNTNRRRSGKGKGKGERARGGKGRNQQPNLNKPIPPGDPPNDPPDQSNRPNLASSDVTSVWRDPGFESDVVDQVSKGVKDVHQGVKEPNVFDAVTDAVYPDYKSHIGSGLQHELDHQVELARAEQAKLDSVADDIQAAVVLDTLMATDESIAEADPEEVAMIAQTIYSTNPHVAKDPMQMRYILREALELGGVDMDMVQRLQKMNPDFRRGQMMMS